MTNERWRAEMPTNFVAVDDGSDEPLRCVEEATHLELVTRANAELDASEAEKAALTKERDELMVKLETVRKMCARESGLLMSFSEFSTPEERSVMPNVVYFSDTLLDVIAGREPERDENPPKSDAEIIKELESELAARRARDEDVRYCALSLDGAPEARRLLACGWLKEGGS